MLGSYYAEARLLLLRNRAKSSKSLKEGKKDKKAKDKAGKVPSVLSPLVPQAEGGDAESRGGDNLHAGVDADADAAADAGAVVATGATDGTATGAPSSESAEGREEGTAMDVESADAVTAATATLAAAAAAVMAGASSGESADCTTEAGDAATGTGTGTGTGTATATTSGAEVLSSAAAPAVPPPTLEPKKHSPQKAWQLRDILEVSSSVGDVTAASAAAEEGKPQTRTKLSYQPISAKAPYSSRGANGTSNGKMSKSNNNSSISISTTSSHSSTSSGDAGVTNAASDQQPFDFSGEVASLVMDWARTCYEESCLLSLRSSSCGGWRGSATYHCRRASIDRAAST